MSASKGRGWFWNAERGYTGNAIQAAQHRILKTYDFALLTQADQDSVKNLFMSTDILPPEHILPIFRNRWRLEDRIEEFDTKFQILENPKYIEHLKGVDSNITKKEEFSQHLTFAIFLLRARIELDIYETRNHEWGFGWGRQQALKARILKLDKYLDFYNSINRDSIEKIVRYQQYRLEPAYAPITPTINWINAGRLFWVWGRGIMQDILTLIGLANGPGVDALNEFAPYAGHMSYVIYALRGLLRILDDVSLICYAPEDFCQQVPFLERLAYYIDTSKDWYVNDVIFWGPGNVVTCGALNIVSAATGGLITLGLLVVDLSMSLNGWLEAKAYYEQEKAAITALRAELRADDPKTGIYDLRLADLQLKNKHDWERAQLSMFCFFLLVVALAIVCVALCYAGLPIAGIAVLSIACSAICYASGFMRIIGEHWLSQSQQTELSEQLKVEADGAPDAEFIKAEVAWQKQHIADIKAYKTTLYQVNMVGLIGVSVAAMLILSLAAWPAWAAILSIAAICLVIGALQWVYLACNDKLNEPEIARYSELVETANPLSP